MQQTTLACLGMEPRDVGRDDQDPLGFGLRVLHLLKRCNEFMP
jgi:hypothetical protein